MKALSSIRTRILAPLALVSGLMSIPGQGVSAQELPSLSSLDRYVELGLEANLDLAQQRLIARESFEAWNVAKAGYRPNLLFDARYSRAEGGRDIVIPVGDLVNPIYGALNGILDPGGPGPFSPIANTAEPFLLPQEQETRLRLTQVLWNPALNGNIRAARETTASKSDRAPNMGSTSQ